jgi:hypothetical protein
LGGELKCSSEEGEGERRREKREERKRGMG